MTAFLLGKKIGMTRVFDATGRDIPVTVVLAEDNVVTQVKHTETDGYEAIQIGSGSIRQPKKPQAGHLKASQQPNLHVMRDLRLAELPEGKAREDMPSVGDVLSVRVFTPGDKVQVTGQSKGKGFQGVIKRHGFHRGPKTHGSDHHRAPGSIGSMFPQHVMKGKRLPGHMGAEQVTVKNIEVFAVQADNHTLLLKGALPGPRGTMLEIKKA